MGYQQPPCEGTPRRNRTYLIHAYQACVLNQITRGACGERFHSPIVRYSTCQETYPQARDYGRSRTGLSSGCNRRSNRFVVVDLEGIEPTFNVDISHALTTSETQVSATRRNRTYVSWASTRRLSHVSLSS